MRQCLVKIEGVTPYSASRAVDDEDFPRGSDETVGQWDRRVWREKATRNPEGFVCVPAMAFKMGCDEAAKRLAIKVSERGKTHWTKYFQAGQICDEDMSIGVRVEDMESISIWANADGVRGSGKRVKRVFPYIRKWSGEARFSILDDTIPIPVFERVLTASGLLVGVGRFRPEKGGFNGRFTVGEFKWSTV
jgi:hypothetical protein